MPRCNACGKNRTMMNVVHRGVMIHTPRGMKWDAIEYVCRVCQRWARKLGVKP